MIVDGVELLRKIANDEFKKGQRIKDTQTQEEFVYTFDFSANEMSFLAIIDGYEEVGNPLEAYYTIPKLAIAKFEILSEEDEEIDIQSIEELDEECYFINELAFYRGTGEYEVVKQQNKIIKAIKQLDNKIK